MSIGTQKKISARIMDRLAQSESYKLRGKYQKALDLAEQILVDDPSCIEAAEEVADNLLSLERHKAATKAAEYVLKHHNKSYIANFVLGFIASCEERWTCAAEHFQKSDAGQKDNPEILRCLGWALFHDNQKTEGLAILNRALALRNDDSAILCDIAACLLDLDRTKEASEYLKRAQDVSPEDPRIKDLLVILKEISDFRLV